jgi:non-specific serine/threonine protein kinase
VELTRVVSGAWLQETLNQMQSPAANHKLNQILEKNLKATLRPYQNRGVAWLHMLNQLRLGAVLADDMGLGKTIQIIGLCVLRKAHTGDIKSPGLLVVPASLIGNWRSEIERFAPTLKFWIAHPSGDGNQQPTTKEFDLCITTYGAVARLSWITEKSWDLIILDEAQAIKNPAAKQTRSIKAIQSQHRLALTGTPVENHLSDLWSLFDFVSPGLLGSAQNFQSFIKSKNKQSENPYGPLRALVKPYILRRLKTDKSVISDLPEKTEIKAYCALSKAQVVLYQKSVELMKKEIESSEGIKRRGIILSYLMRFKQICNHPSQCLKDGEYDFLASGKYLRLKEICEVIAEKQEKVLVFTQFKEMTEPLSNYLKTLFGCQGLVLHGETPVKKRMEMVEKFQSDDGPPFFVLSLKAGGTGLNLTAASHVIHFDRWWNPAKENQATDRLHRMGQTRGVQVFKLATAESVEGRIADIITSKTQLSGALVEESDLTLNAFSREELLDLITRFPG